MSVEDFVKDIPSDSVDLVCCSPPYAQKRNKSYSGISVEEYPEWLFDISQELMRILKPSGSFVLNIKEGVNLGKKETYVFEYVLKMKEYWTDTFIWNKTNPYPSGNPRRLKDGFEYCFHFTKTKKYKYFPNNCLVPANPKWIKDNLKRKNKGSHNVNNGSGLNMAIRTTSDMVRPSNVITLATNTTNTNHPATFPIGLPEFFIKLMTEKKDLVFDPFMGSGTTAIAAMKLERYWIGCDKEQKYVDLALDNIRRVNGKE